MLDVICFGEILWDVFEARPRGAEPIARVFRRELGGAPANVATGLARLGVRVAVVGGVGQDRLGDALVAHLRQDNVDVRFVARLPNRTGLAFVTRDARGEPEFIFYRHESADVSVRAEHITPGMGHARWALVGTSTLMTPELAWATSRFLDAAKHAGARVLVDLNVRAHLWPNQRTMQTAIGELAERADLVKASDADLRAVSGANGLRWLQHHAQSASWLITRGGGMASAIGEHGEVHAPAKRIRCVDATGGGDAFIAGSLATLLAAKAVPGSSAWHDAGIWSIALRVGHVMGKKAVSHLGAVAGLKRLGLARAMIDRVRRNG